MRNRIIPGIYEHYRGEQYLVLGEVVHSETRERMILYMPLYGAYELTVRPKTMFLETVNINGKKERRFRFVKKVSTP